MKKIILFCYLFFCLSVVYAQEEHLTFKGIPIDGTIKEFVSKLREKGFEFEEDYSAEAKNFITQILKKYDINIDIPVQTPSEKMANLTDYAELIGDFAGYKDCSIVVDILDQKNLVYYVSVYFPRYTSWEDIKYNYNDIKTMLSKKYGEPEKCEDYFYESPKDDDDKIHELNCNRFKFYCKYTIPNGRLYLEIVNLSWGENYVKLTYYDKKNTNIINSLALDDL